MGEKIAECALDEERVVEKKKQIGKYKIDL